MTQTTLVNPGSNLAVEKITLKGFLYKIKRNIRRKSLRLVLYCLRADGINMINDCLSPYRKPKFHCPVCGNDSTHFHHLYNSSGFSWDSCCTHCSSRFRHRALLYLYQDLLAAHPFRKVLHFAPEPIFYSLFKNKTESYLTTDYFLKDVDFPNEDIQKLSFQDESFDLILCNHVIEHVPNDDAAFSELSRITSKGGRCVITVPGDYTREKTVVYKNLTHNGHFRDYGQDVAEKLKKYFGQVEIIDLYRFNSRQKLSIGHPHVEWCFICTP